VIEGTSALCPGDTYLINPDLSEDDYIFQWTRNDIDIDGANESSYLVTESGLYGLKLTNKGTAGCFIDPLPILIEYFDAIIFEEEVSDLTVCTGENMGGWFNLTEATDGVTF